MEPPAVLPASLEAVRAHRAELRESMAALDQALGHEAVDRVGPWAERVDVALVELSGDLRVHIELNEGPDGLHQEAVMAAPRLADAVRRLTADHVELTRQVDELQALLASGAGDAVDVAEVRRRGGVLLDRLRRHRQAGADVVYQAYAADLGGET